MNTIRYFTKKTLKNANDEAIKSKRNRALDPKALAKHLKHLPDDTKFPVVFSMIHNEWEPEFRVAVVADATGLILWLDVPGGVFNALPTAEVNGAAPVDGGVYR